MRLVLHILRKDLRRHRWEILLYLLTCVSWTWQTANPSGWLWQQTRNIIPGIFFGLWFLLTIRVVQGESLVGDSEFWQTRPYRWHQLLAAKACFLLICLNIPLFVAETVLLAHAGFPFSLRYLPGLLFLQLCFIYFLTFPATVLATLTDSLVQWILTVVGLLVFAMVMSWLPWSKLPATLATQENVAGVIGSVMIVPALAFALLWQYARRRVWPARLAAGAAVLIVPLIVLIAPTDMIRSLAYEQPDGPTPLHLSIADDNSGAGRSYIWHVRTFTRDPRIEIPLTASTTDPDTLINTDGWRVVLTGDGGWRWQTGWINHTLNIGGTAATTGIFFDMPAAVANELAQKHVKARVELAFSVYRLDPVRRIETSGDAFSPADGIICRWHLRNEEEELRFDGIGCDAALRLPPVILTEIESGENTCPVAKDAQPLPAGHRAINVDYGTSMPAAFDPNPVRSLNLLPGAWSPPIPDPDSPKTSLQAGLCRGTPLTVRTGSLKGAMRATFDLGSIGTEKRVTDDPDDTIGFQP